MSLKPGQPVRQTTIRYSAEEWAQLLKCAGEVGITPAALAHEVIVGALRLYTERDELPQPFFRYAELKATAAHLNISQDELVHRRAVIHQLREMLVERAK